MIVGVAFLLLAALLLWFVIGGRGPWQVKLAAIVIVPLFMLLLWNGVKSYEGWPTSQTPPKTLYYVNGYSIEPDPVDHVKGAIYIWGIPAKTGGGPLGYKPVTGEPRAYVLPYSQKLENQIQAANNQAGAGQQVVMKHGKTKSSGGTGGVNDPGQFKFYNLPPINLPPKTPGQ